MGFIKVVFIIIAVFYGFKLIARIMLPIVLKKLMQKFGNSHQSHNFSHQQSDKKKEGEVNIKKTASNKKRFTGGEYVNYEEIK